MIFNPHAACPCTVPAVAMVAGRTPRKNCYGIVADKRQDTHISMCHKTKGRIAQNGAVIVQSTGNAGEVGSEESVMPYSDFPEQDVPYN